MKSQITSSIFHFFVRLMELRGYFVQENNLEGFNYPEEMIAARSSSGFPDFVLKLSDDPQYTGGEFIELKDTKSHTIASFNSTIPTKTKRIDDLAKKIQVKLNESGETNEAIQERDVYYLIRGIKQSQSYPLSKTILVSGAYFETMPPDEVLTDAFSQVALDSMSNESMLERLKNNFRVKQSKFAQTRRVKRSSVSVRFRVMTQVDPVANLLNDSRYPMIGNNTLTFLHHEEPRKNVKGEFVTYDWDTATTEIKQTIGYTKLNHAFKDIDNSLKEITRVSILDHPLNGPFFLAQVSINP